MSSSRFDADLGLVAGQRIDQTGRPLVLKDEVEAGLIACNAGVDLVASVIFGFAHPVGISEQRPGHRHHVGIAVGEHLFCHFGHVDAVGGHQWDAHFTLEASSHPGVGGSRYHRRDGRNARLMPSNARVDDAGARFFDGLAQTNNLFPGRAVLDQIEHRESIDDDEVIADGLSGSSDDLDG